MNRFRAGLILTVVLFVFVFGVEIAITVFQISPSQLILGLTIFLLALLVAILFVDRWFKTRSEL